MCSLIYCDDKERQVSMLVHAMASELADLTRKLQTRQLAAAQDRRDAFEALNA